MHDIMQDAPIYQEIPHEGREQGRLEAARHFLLIVTEKRFPALLSLAQEHATCAQAFDKMEALIVAISSAQDELEAQNTLQGTK